MGFITSIGTAVPPHRFSQSTLSDFMIRAMQLDYVNSRKLKTIFRSSGIAYRHSVLDDYGKTSGFTFYPNNSNVEPFPSTEKRLLAYRNHALTLSSMAVHDCISKRKNFDLRTVTHLITVSCTGMYAPGLDIELVHKLGLHTDVERTAINFMGCYAAFNAIKTAEAYCNMNPHAVILIVCIELCSLHFQKEVTDDNLLANGLFADGAAAVLMQSTAEAGICLSPVAFHNDILFTEDQHMAWTIGNFGFEMRLSSYVPDVIQGAIRSLTLTLLKKIEKRVGDIQYFAIHPGGKKILEVIEHELGIHKQENQAAYRVLKNYGNMSSPTIVFVLNEVFKKLHTGDENSLVLSFAFGPGITMEAILFRVNVS